MQHVSIILKGHLKYTHLKDVYTSPKKAYCIKTRLELARAYRKFFFSFKSSQMRAGRW